MKKYILSLIPFILSIGCFAAFNMIGSKVLEDGTLSEPFFLIPLGFLFFLIGMIGLSTRLGLMFINYRRAKKQKQ